MFKLVPREPLGPGPYGLHVGEMVGISKPEIYDFLVLEDFKTKSVSAWVDTVNQASPENRPGTIAALTRHGQQAVPIFERLLESDDPAVQLSAAQALAQSGPGTGIPAFLDALGSENDRVRSLAESYLLDHADAVERSGAYKNHENARLLLDRGKQRRTMADLRSMGTSIEEYSIDNNKYPTANGVEALRPFVEPMYIRRLPDQDGWGHPLIVESNAKSYTLRSYGANGKADPIINAGQGGKTSEFNADIVFSNGSFLQWPEGPQH